MTLKEQITRKESQADIKRRELKILEQELKTLKDKEELNALRIPKEQVATLPGGGYQTPDNL